jgi:hypothetical protein
MTRTRQNSTMQNIGTLHSCLVRLPPQTCLSNDATTTSPGPVVKRRAMVSSISTISWVIFGMFSIVHRRPSAGCAVCLRRERNWRDRERKIWSSSGVVVVVGRGRTCRVRGWNEGVRIRWEEWWFWRLSCVMVTIGFWGVKTQGRVVIRTLANSSLFVSRIGV